MKLLDRSLIKARCIKGVSLLEVMFSILILGIGVLGLAPLIEIALHDEKPASALNVATVLAQQELESLKALESYGVLPMLDSRDSVSGIYQVNRRVVDDEILQSVPAGMYKLSVNVKWTDKKQKQRSIDYSIFKPKTSNSKS